MNYYYDLPNDVIDKIENINKEEELNKKSLNEWKNKMMLVNKIFKFACDIDEYTESIEEGMTYREIIEELGEDEGKLTFKGMEYQYYNLHLPYMRGEIKD
jgi:hypothetical protein